MIRILAGTVAALVLVVALLATFVWELCARVDLLEAGLAVRPPAVSSVSAPSETVAERRARYERLAASAADGAAAAEYVKRRAASGDRAPVPIP